MKPILLTVFTLFFSTALLAQDKGELAPADIFSQSDESDLSLFIWKKRPVVVFADSPSDPRYAEQVALLTEAAAALQERDVVILLDTNPREMTPLRRKLRPRGFMLAILGKDGGVKLRKPFPWDGREISRSIDKMPMRKRELREQKRAAAQN